MKKILLTSLLLICTTEASFVSAQTDEYQEKLQTENFQTKTQTEYIQSELEKHYSRRAGKPLKQFGYTLFSNELDAPAPPMGAVQDNFILGSNDTLLITFTGQRNDQDTYTIDSRGMLIIKDIPPISAAGQSIKQVRSTLNNYLSSIPNTKAYLSLSEIRQIGVLTVGHINKPGRKTLSAFNSVLDALNAAGGIQKQGSLRSIKLIRNGRTKHIDLYSLLLHGNSPADILLQDGDRIIVPPIGPTLAVSGQVNRPGIYEIKKQHNSFLGINKANSEELSVISLLSLSGGAITPDQNRMLKLKISKNGVESVTDITNDPKTTFQENTILSIKSSQEKRSGIFTVTGETRHPGIHDLSETKTLNKLLSDKTVFGDDIYPLIGIIKRKDKNLLTSKYLSYSIRAVINNENDIKLQDEDNIIFISNDDISIIYNDNDTETSPPENTTKNKKKSILKNQLPQDLISYLKDQEITIRGAVHAPGSYPIANDTPIENIIAAAGGLTRIADQNNIEITRKDQTTKRTTINRENLNGSELTLSPGDAIRVNQVPDKAHNEKMVILAGEVRYPGEYDILPGDTVSSLLDRAGGLTEQAYPAGSIFSRESERRAEEKRFKSTAQDMEKRLATAIENDKNKPNANQIEMVRALAKELSEIEAIGRITVETDPGILQSYPERDMLLEGGDRIHIPKRPLTVRVSGEVLSPASLQFRKDKNPRDYINEAGGYTYHADQSRTFVIFPDGSAQPLKVSAWNHTPLMIPPGSTIIIPRDPEPFDFLESAKEVGQILSNLAITSVFIDDIRD